MDRHSGGGPPPHLRGRPVSGLEAAHAIEYFDPFLNATTLKNILGYHRSMCEFLHLKPNVFPQFYPKLRANLTSWRAKAVWKKFDARASHKCYAKGKACAGTRVLVIGAGPCGLRTAIEAQLLGAKVVVIEKRDRLSRNNVLHLWPFVIEDLRMLGAKKFFGKFCAGAIDHISIRQLQCILLKVALLIGVEIHTEVSFEKVLEPSSTEKTGWRADIKPENHPVSQYEFDVIIAADGKRNTLQGFKRKEFRGKLAIAITANFINKKSEAEARVEEISGVAFIFNQKFFKDLQAETRIDLENIVYYKDDTHYFVMTAKKASLLEKGVIKQDLSDTEKLLAPDNVDRDALKNYARQAADFSTNYQLPHLEFAVNHYGQPDVAMFDFTSMYAAENASKVIERDGSRLLMILVGDSLLEPFWPTGSGCARGFLSSLDAAWAIRSYCSGQMTPLDVLAERESIYRLLAQTTPDNLNKDWKSYTLDPSTRYPNLNKTIVSAHQTVCLYDTDNPNSIDKMKRASLEAVSRLEHIPKKRRRGNVDKEVLISWLTEQLRDHEDVTITDISSAFRNGKTLCAIIHHYRPDLLDYSAIKDIAPAKCNQLAMDILEKELGLSPFMTGEEITNSEDYLAMATYLTQVYDTFRGEIPHIKHPKLNIRSEPSSSKIPRIIHKSPSKPRKQCLSPRLLKTLNKMGGIYGHSTIVSQSITAVKQGRKKANGEAATDKKIHAVEKKSVSFNKETTSPLPSELGPENRKKQMSSDDLTIIEKDRKVKMSRKRRSSLAESKPLKTLSEKTFLTTNIRSLKNVEKGRKVDWDNKAAFLDVPYTDEYMTNTKNKLKTEEQPGKTKKTIKKSSLAKINEGTQVKKVKSRNVCTSVHMSENKILKTKKLKLKKSKLSVIPENIDDKINYKAEDPSHVKDTYFVNEANSTELTSESQIVTDIKSGKLNMESNKTDFSKTETIKDCGYARKCLDQNTSLNFKNSVKVFHCETFVQDSFDSLALPSLPALKPAINKPCHNVDTANKAVNNTQIKNDQLIGLPMKRLVHPHRKLCTPKTPLVKLPSRGDGITTIFGLKNSFSPLQMIRKHLLMKKQQLSLVLSNSKVPLTRNISDANSSNSWGKTPLVAKTNRVKSIANGKNTKEILTSRIRTYSTYSKESYSSNTQSVNIEVIQKSSNDRITCQNVEYNSTQNLVKITSRGFLCKCTKPNDLIFKASVNKTDFLTNSNLASEKVANECRTTRINNRIRSRHCVGTNKTKTVEQLYENKHNFLKNDDSSHMETARHAYTPRLEQRGFSDRAYPRRPKKKSKTHLLINAKQSLAPADAKIINSLGTSTLQTSNVRKTCPITSKRNKEIQGKQKFSLPNSLRGIIIKRQKLYGDIRTSKRSEPDSSKDFSKLNVNSHLEEPKKTLDMEIYDDDDGLGSQTFIRVQEWISQQDFKAEDVKKDPERETELPENNKHSEFSFKSIKTSSHHPLAIPFNQPSRPSSRHKRHAEVMVHNKPCSIERKQRKRRTLERIGPSVEQRQRCLEEIASNRHDRQSRRKQQRQRQTEQFLKSMQMLQANCKPDCSEPFEDYSIFLYRQTAPKFKDRVKDLEKQFTYVPDHDNKITGLKPLTNTNAEEDVASKIKSLQDKWCNREPAEKKPKDLMRSIGKIETSDWNIKQIEKKILENKIGKPSSLNADKERVPRWSKEEFRARQTKMEKKHLDRQDSTEEVNKSDSSSESEAFDESGPSTAVKRRCRNKYADIDRNIKELELKLKEGNNRELGQNKVASITEKLVSQAPQEKEKPVEKPVQPKPVNLPVQSGSEYCHFCGKRVYLMERLSAEGRFFHHGCFKCQYCHSQLRLGSYMFDRDGQYGYRFFCMHHYGMQGELPRPTKVSRKPSQKGPREAGRSPQKKPLSGVAGVDLLDRVQTPERIQFSNLSSGNISSDHEEPLSQMDEDEWTDKNFGASCNELDESDDDSSSISDTDSDDEDAYDDALEQPITKEGTMKWAERWKNSYRKGRHSDSDGFSSSDHSSYYENSSDDSDSDTATEGEEEIRARELRRQEVRVEPPVVQTDTGTDTEMVSEESSSESSEIQNSATEISTDSEFAQDEPTPTREVPSITLNDFHVTKTRGSGNSNYPKRIQVKSGYIQRTRNEKPKPDIELKLSPLVPPTPAFKKPAPVLLPRTEGYALNRTQSTGGIAAKVSLELKKKYLLGECGTNSIQKSGSASTLDTKFKSFQTTISDCQKLLKPAPEVSASMQMFCSKLDERHSPVSSPQGAFVFSGPKTTPVEESKPDLPPPDITITTITEAKGEKLQDNDPESRPRSPVHEASISVPSIDWSKQNQSQSSDSLSLSGSASENEAAKTPNFHIPRVEVHAAKESDREDMTLDSLCIEAQKVETKVASERITSSVNEHTKSITSDKKSLNQPKSLPNLETVLPEIHKALHVKIKSDKEDSPDDNKSLKTVSGRSSPEATAALTETELSDWARDENGSDSIELDMSRESDNKKPIKIANFSEFEETVNHHVCGKHSKEFTNKTILTEAMSNALSRNLDNIEFMDTGTETSSDDGIADSQTGYVLFKNEDDLVEDSLNPNINEILEPRVYLNKKEATPEILERNTGYCEIVKETRFGGEVIDLNSADLERLKQNQTLADHEEDSLIIVETGTTTEENTCSDSTVKNITEIGPDTKVNKDKPSAKIENLQKQRLEEKLAKVKAEQALLKEQRLKEASEKENIENNLQYEEHCQRLQSKVEFGNARDSIDIRKSRRRSKTDSPQKPDLIQEEKEIASSPKDITLNLSPVIRPDVIYKKENIKKERDVNKKLIEEMVMNKMKAENKSLERKKRNRSNLGSLSPCRPYSLQKSNTSDVVAQISLSNLDNSCSPNSIGSSTYVTPDLLSNSIPLQKSVKPVTASNSSSVEKYATPMTSFTPKQNSTRPLSVFSTFTDVRKLPETPLTNPENFSMPDIRKNLFGDEFRTPKAPPRYNRPSGVAKTAEKMKENARARARLLSNEDLGLSPEDKILKLREKVNRKPKENETMNPLVQESIESLVINTERRNSLLYSNDTLNKKRSNSFRKSKSGDSETSLKLSDVNNGFSASIRPKSISEIPKNLSVSKSTEMHNDGNKKICKSDPNLLDTSNSKSKKKSKDRERRKSITKLIAGIFTKKSPTSPGSKGLFAKLSPKSKSKDTVIENPKPRKSLSEVDIKKREPTPPPIPPLPVNYTMKTDESSDGEILDDKRQDRGSCDTLDQSGNFETSMTGLTGRRSGKARRVSRQAQLKRHRMAQEIQRKLEETEVKTRELEQRGVEVEKALRGEDDGRCMKDESDLLQEWFDLMRDRTELRRYEKELMVRAEELELEDRHSRLQVELRERLECNENKTEEDLKVEESIINEMMDIVAKRDTLIAVLEEDRLRYSHEDKDLEEQMLAKGLMLTPIQKSPEK